MKKLVVAFLFTSLFLGLNAQVIPDAYMAYVQEADSLYKLKKYKEAAFCYSSAFKANKWKAMSDDRYSAACCWALANYPDSAFFNLNRIAKYSDFGSYVDIVNDKDLFVLHEDPRWKPFIEKIKKNEAKANALLNKPLIKTLDSIYEEDQYHRKQLDFVYEKYGQSSKQIDSVWNIIRVKDSANLLTVTSILDKHGWLGPEVVGGMGNLTLFLVIQHSDQKTQEKYLPVMREAVKNKKANPADLALLEDRVALGQGKEQIYGSQIEGSPGNYRVSPLKDPENVDKRRAEVGLQPLEDYVKHWDIKWDVEEYKKQKKANKAKR